MSMNTWKIILIVVLFVGLSLVPAIFNLSLVHYITGVVSVVIILLALAFFVINTRTSMPSDVILDEHTNEEKKTKWQQCVQTIRNSWNKVINACNSVGFILVLCILLIISIGVFDALMVKKNEVHPECNCSKKVQVLEITHQPDTLSKIIIDTLSNVRLH